MQKLRRDVITSVKSLHCLEIIQLLARRQSLLPVDRFVISSHVIDYGYLSRHFAFACPTFLQEGLDLRLVLSDVIIVYVLNTIYIKLRRMVKVMRERKIRPLDLN